MISLRLQPLTASLLPAAVDLDRRCFGHLWSLEGYRREMESPNSDLLVFVREGVAEEPVSGEGEQGVGQSILSLGCYWAIVEEAHITVLAVDPTYQRQGLGQAMLLVLLTSAQQRGLEWATLEVRISNQSALFLYEKFGFKAAGRRKRYYQDTGEDALVLWLGGLQSPTFTQSLAVWQQEIDDRLAQSGWWLERGKAEG